MPIDVGTVFSVVRRMAVNFGTKALASRRNYMSREQRLPSRTRGGKASRQDVEPRINTRSKLTFAYDDLGGDERKSSGARYIAFRTQPWRCLMLCKDNAVPHMLDASSGKEIVRRRRPSPFDVRPFSACLIPLRKLKYHR